MRYTPDRRGVARLLTSTDMADTMADVGARAADFAASVAPRDTGAYASSFVASVEVHDGRQTAIVASTDEGAAAIEWGGGNRQGHHTLARVLDWTESAS